MTPDGSTPFTIPPAPGSGARPAPAAGDRGRMLLLTARWVFPIATPPIEDGAVLIHDHRIVQVGRRDEVRLPTAARRVDLGQAAILPGLVNCHTHLELSDLGRVEAPGFVPWLLEVRSRRRRLGPEAQAAAAERAVRMLLGSGVTSVGEVSTSGQSVQALRRSGLRGVVYHEVLGVDPARTPEIAARVPEEVSRLASVAPPRLRAGLAPHSPYALSDALLVRCRDLALELDLPVCTHVAESREEVEYFGTGGGEIPGCLYPAVGANAPPRRGPAGTPLGYLEALGALSPRCLVVHAVHVDEVDWQRLRRHGASVAHCPRSNAALAGGTAPVAAFLDQGIPVGLGTDSLASAPSLDLWDEMRAVLDTHAVEPAAVLRMGTLGGAQALGLHGEVGSLEAGKRADLIAVSVASMSPRDPEGSLLAGTRGADLLLSLIDGERRFCRPEVTAPCP